MLMHVNAGGADSATLRHMTEAIMAQMQSTPLGWTRHIARWFGGLGSRSEPAAPPPLAGSGARIVAVRPQALPAPRSWRGVSARANVLTCCGAGTHVGALPETESPPLVHGGTSPEAHPPGSRRGNRKAVA